MRNLNNLYKGCKGCSRNIKEHCIIKYHDKVPKQCPCITCIVKSMCKLGCVNRIEIIDKIPQSDKREMFQIYLNEQSIQHLSN